MYRHIIQNSIDYIENNLCSELTAQELSKKAGFSLFHYYRVFTSSVGIPVMQYITRRRLLYAVYEMSKGMKKADAALLYGFDTYAGCYKAFLREFGCTPSSYLSNFKIAKPYKINILQEEPIMVPHKQIMELLSTYWRMEDVAIKDVIYEGTGKKSDSLYYVGDNHLLKFSISLGGLKNHIKISEALEKEGLLAATPVETCDGDKYVQYGQLYCCLTKRIQGQQILPQNLFREDAKGDARFIGEIVGHLSIALSDVDIVVNDANMYESVVNWAMPVLQKANIIPNTLCRKYTTEFADLYTRLPQQIIHRNLSPSNIILEGNKWGFIEFELSERNIRIFDPCYAATAILSEFYSKGERFVKWIEIYKEIMYGYDTVARLSEDERKAIPYVVLSNQLLATVWFSQQDKYKDVYEVNKLMTKSIVEDFDMLVL
ncbi:MAG: helix-turn-helix domain-containing protein [Lachnospiraceae bacterium]|nr:helix-turn-helix domain-containing protein [Lachnospiraceae bacterium]